MKFSFATDTVTEVHKYFAC